ncbi:hypothetical protein MJO28_005123 [Puccinia striiformis f. sp. tritici]|uniref:Uncharacterized protein n=1 Tax=Puccinia striiformis f. sp. tritici TaxID=168172 RepID=A0ACC0EJC9_9BASI|nr:hypothetical protein MJO28_005123 [Puccinia striiformis f. sp. tritici]
MNELETNPSIGIDQAGAEPSPDANKEPQASRKRRRKSDAQKAHRKRLSLLARPQRRKNSRAREFENVISNEGRFVAALISAKKLLKYDLFPEISKEVALQNKGRSQEGHEYCEDSSNGPHKNSQPRSPTEDENVEALKQIKDKFRTIDHGSVRLLNQKSNQIICVLEFLKIPNLDQKPREDLNFLCGFFHDCKPFISPDLSENSYDAITSAIGWCKETTHLQILHQYRNEEAIEKNQQLYAKLMEDSEKAGSILWDTFSRFGNVAAENTRKHMMELASCGSTSSLAFPSHNFHDDLNLDGDEDSENPLSFAMVIPTFKTTGKIALEAEGHRVDNGQFLFPDIKEAIVFPPDTICMMIFRAHEYAHGTLRATEVGDSTRLAICIQAPIKITEPDQNNKEGPHDEQTSEVDK